MKENLRHMIVLETKYYGPTNTKGARIRVSTGKLRRFYPFKYGEKCPHEFAAGLFLRNEIWYSADNPLVITGVANGSDARGYYFIVEKEKGNE